MRVFEVIMKPIYGVIMLPDMICQGENKARNEKTKSPRM